MNIVLTHTRQELEELFPQAEQEELKKQGRLYYNPYPRHMNMDEMYRLCPEADLIVSEWMTGLDASYLAKNSHLRAFIRVGVEILNVDFNACRRYGILVCNTPGGFSVPVAEFTMAMLLCWTKDLCRYSHEMKKGRILPPAVMLELCGKTAVVVGLGTIGTRVAELCSAFGMKVIGVDKYVVQFSFLQMSIEEALPLADVVTLHVKLCEETIGFMSTQRISLMKKGAFLINTGRGALVDEAALYRALADYKLAGAALDVFTDERPEALAENKLAALPNVLATPHIAGFSHEAHLRNAREAIRIVGDIINGISVGTAEN